MDANLYDRRSYTFDWQVTSAVPTFEELALRLVESSDPLALQTFLLTRLRTLGASDKAQVLFPLPPSLLVVHISTDTNAHIIDDSSPIDL
jgi:hypothetical protein